MKIASLFGAAIVCFSATAMAYDMTYLLPVKAHHSESMRVELPSGNSSLTVRSDGRPISCHITDAATGNPTGPDQVERTPCYFNAKNLALPHTVYVRVTNSSDEEFQVTIQVVDSK